MICKKCGREYEDDMPKCLWCDAPRESEPAPETPYCDILNETPQKLIDPKLEQELAKNVYRGQSAISWSKFMIFINIISFAIEIKTLKAIEAGVAGTKLNIPLTNEFYLALITLIGLFLFASIPTLTFLYKNWRWIYFAQKETTKFTDSFFAPWGAVVCYYIPIANYFVFKDLLKNQSKILTGMTGKDGTVPKSMLNRFLIMNIICPICNLINYFNHNETLFLLLSTVAWFFYIYCNIKLIRMATENEHSMSLALQNNAINQKIEDAIAEREKALQENVQE